MLSIDLPDWKMSCKMESNYETVCLCALNSIFGYEPRIALALIESLGSAAAVFAMSEEEKEAVLGPYSKYRSRIVRSELDAAESVLQRLHREGTSFVGITSEVYPERLKVCEDAPVGIFVRSVSPVEQIFSDAGHYVAVVGTREITPYGEQWCRDIVRTLADSGTAPCIVSGLAYGTDIIAHKTAVECGLPTIAVMATGTDTVYPGRHRDFAERIVGLPGCALVTDYPPGTAPVALNFIRRNRIIAGLSDSVILVESAVRGGGMITCSLAFSYSRSVYALPGRGDDSRSQGCNRLIREGVAEIIDSLEGLNVQLGLCERGHGRSGRNCGGGHFPDDGSSSRRGSSDGTARDRLAERYSRTLLEDKISAMAEILLKVRERRGIDFDGLCAATGLSYRSVAELTALLENDGMISIDLLRRCSIRG